MEKSMSISSEYFSNNGVRRATIEIGENSYITTLYEHEDPVRRIADSLHSLYYWEDCCENFVNYWGTFKE